MKQFGTLEVGLVETEPGLGNSHKRDMFLGTMENTDPHNTKYPEAGHMYNHKECI